MIRILKICVFATMWLMPSTSTHLPLVLDMFKLNLKYPIIWLICLLRCIKFELNWIGIERKWIELELNWKILNPIWIRIELNWKILNPTWIGNWIELKEMNWSEPWSQWGHLVACGAGIALDREYQCRSLYGLENWAFITNACTNAKDFTCSKLNWNDVPRFMLPAVFY